MQLIQLLETNPKDVKVHLAVWNGVNNPLDLYFDGSFKEWQEHQNKRNFQRKYILSLIRLSDDNLWLFAGVYEVIGVKSDESKGFFYETKLTRIGADFLGRMVINYQRKGRNSYPYGENVWSSATVYEIKPEALAFSDFNSFKDVHLTRQQLELLYKHEYPSWRSALSSVSGVYLISDYKTGKLYVGSAYGEGGFWHRWSDYASNHHGGNNALKLLYKSEGAIGFHDFSYSILETCDLDMPIETVIGIESRWKERLLTRVYGYNQN